jgi:serine palmitoyltransferase
LFIIYIIFKKSYKTSKPNKLTEKEIEELIKDWKPEPLITDDIDEEIPVNTHVVTSDGGKIIKVNNKEVLNFSSYSFLGLSGDKEIKVNIHH